MLERHRVNLLPANILQSADLQNGVVCCWRIRVLRVVLRIARPHTICVGSVSRTHVTVMIGRHFLGDSVFANARADRHERAAGEYEARYRGKDIVDEA